MAPPAAIRPFPGWVAWDGSAAHILSDWKGIRDCNAIGTRAEPRRFKNIDTGEVREFARAERTMCGAFVPETGFIYPVSPAASQVCEECVAEYRRARPVSVVPFG